MFAKIINQTIRQIRRFLNVCTGWIVQRVYNPEHTEIYSVCRLGTMDVCVIKVK